MHPEEGPVNHIVALLNQNFGAAADTAVVLGSGLGGVVEQLEIEGQASYADLGLPDSTVVGHAGRAIVGKLGGARHILMSGRVHLYEGYSGAEVVRGVRSLHRWGVRRLVLTNSCGCISDGLRPGSLVLMSDHINLQGTNPLIGPAWGTRFPDMTFGYHPGIREILKSAAAELGIELIEGVYAAMHGPAYETPAEIQMAKIMGADVVGMSTVPEALAAAEVGLPVVGISVVSNFAAGLTNEALSHDDVTRLSGEISRKVAELLSRVALQYPT
jgi:purine-nucleoside phosphorylase